MKNFVQFIIILVEILKKEFQKQNYSKTITRTHLIIFVHNVKQIMIKKEICTRMFKIIRQISWNLILILHLKEHKTKMDPLIINNQDFMMLSLIYICKSRSDQMMKLIDLDRISFKKKEKDFLILIVWLF